MTSLAPKAAPATFRGPSHRDLLVDEVADRLRMESDIIGERWRRLQTATVRVQNHKDAFRRECAMLSEDQELLEGDRDEFEAEVALKFPAGNLSDEKKMERFKLNVGGARTEATAEVLTRDRFSILAALCSDNAPLDVDEDGSYFFDRDGVLFEQVLNFLRDGVLPDDEETLRGMYNEAAFFRLGLLKKHVEAKFQEIAKKRNDIYERSIQGVPGAGTSGMPGPAANVMPSQIPGGNVFSSSTASILAQGPPSASGMMMPSPTRASAGMMPPMGAAYNGQPSMPMNSSQQAAMAGQYMSQVAQMRQASAMPTGQYSNYMPPMTKHAFTDLQPRLDPRTNSLPDPFGFTTRY